MQLTFLGVASALTNKKNYFHSNMLLSTSKGNLLFDCGSDIRFSLLDAGFSYDDISAVYISHLHGDHIGGLEWLCFSQKFNEPRSIRPHLYISENLVHPLWENALKAGLSSLQGEVADLNSYFEVHPISLEKSKQHFIWSDVQFELVQTVHMINHFEIMPSYGLIFTLNNKTIFITSDTRYTPEHLMIYYEKADLIFHDCDTNKTYSQVHAHYHDLVGLPQEIKAKMWLYHYSPNQLPDAPADGFLGFVKQRQKFSI